MRKTIISFLKESYLKYPEKTACIDEEGQITYKQLWNRSHTVAGNLIEKIKSGTPVPIIMKKSCKTMQLLWGVIKAGGCYVIIDPMLPKDRIDNILDSLNVKLVIGEESIQKKLTKGIQLLLPKDLISKDSSFSHAFVNTRMNQLCDIDPVYIMFTSGSTGIPKGIIANHRSVMDFIEAFTELFQINESEIIGNQAPWDFDVSVKDIFSAAKAGAALQIIPKKYFSLPLQLVKFLDERKVSTLIWAVSALCILSSNNLLAFEYPKYIRKIIFSGEVMPVKQYNIWRQNYPNALFVNVYGPTEITCNCTYYMVNGIYDEDDVIPIGQAFPNERVFLLDSNNSLIEKMDNQKSQTGEICVSGTAVTMGYYNNPKETGRSYVQNPLNPWYPEIIYRTGDLGYYNVKGELCFIARKDHQIKHLGHRIELTEIERIVNRIENVKRCCCTYHDNKIKLFYEGRTVEKNIITEIRKKLPGFMVPQEIHMLESMPINKNGKIDRKKIEDYQEKIDVI